MRGELLEHYPPEPTTPDDEATTTPDRGPPNPDKAVPALDLDEVGEALEKAAPGDALSDAANEGSLSAGEGDRAVDVAATASRVGPAVVIGKVPDADDSSVITGLLCSVPEHGLLGHYESEDEAQEAKAQHLAAQH